MRGLDLGPPNKFFSFVLLYLGLVKAKYILYGAYIHTNHLEIANAEYQNGLDSLLLLLGQGCDCRKSKVAFCWFEYIWSQHI